MRLLDFARNFPPELDLHILVTSNNLALLDEFKKTRAKIKILPIKKVYFALGKIFEVASYVNKNNIEAISSFDVKGLTISVIIKYFFRRKIKIVHHFIDLLHNYHPRHKIILWQLVKFADYIICNSNEVKNVVISSRLLNAKVSVIQNGVDTDYFKLNHVIQEEFKTSLGYQSDHFIIGTISNLRPEKNYYFLIENFTKLLVKYPNLRLLCIGGGPLLEEVKNYVENEELTDKIYFSGYVEDVRPYLSAMDVFTLCSLKEGFPNSLLQAMAMNLPVVSTSAGECTDVLQNGKVGMLFNPKNSEQFISAIIKLINENALRSNFKKIARETVEMNFSIQRMINQYVDFYTSI